MNPPLRTAGDALALRTIADVRLIALFTDHAPHAAHEGLVSEISYFGPSGA